MIIRLMASSVVALTFLLDVSLQRLGVDFLVEAKRSERLIALGIDDVEGQRRRVGKEAVAQPTKARRRSFFQRQQLPVLGVAPSGHKIHEIQLIAFHKNGLGVNVVLVDEEGYPYGWSQFKDHAKSDA